MLKSISDGWALTLPTHPPGSGEVAPGGVIKSKGGIIVHHVNESVSFALVVLMGAPLASKETVLPSNPLAENGDTIMFQDLPGVPQHLVQFDNQRYRLIRHYDIIGVVEVEKDWQEKDPNRQTAGEALAGGMPTSQGEPL